MYANFTWLNAYTKKLDALSTTWLYLKHRNRVIAYSY
jgi:hypothetical protein